MPEHTVLGHNEVLGSPHCKNRRTVPSQALVCVNLNRDNLGMRNQQRVSGTGKGPNTYKYAEAQNYSESVDRIKAVFG
jgi:hypothetical protein